MSAPGRVTVPGWPSWRRSSEGRCDQSEVIKVTSSQDQIWQRTVEQNLSMIRGMSLLHDPLRGFVKRQGKKEGSKSYGF